MRDPGTTPHIGLLMAIAMIGPLATHLVVPALPNLQQHFATDYSTAQLLVSLFMIAFGVMQIVVGPLADAWGRRRVLIGGMVLFSGVSVLCTMATSIEMLVALRILQGATGCVGVVLGRAIVRDVSHGDRTAGMLGYLSMGVSVGPMLAPAAGGLLYEFWGWTSMFWFLAMLSGVGVVFCWFFVPETSARAATRFRLTVLLADFAALLRHRGFLLYGAVVCFNTSVFYCIVIGAPYVAVRMLGVTPAGYGLWFIVVAIGYALGNFIAGRWVGDGRDPRRMVLTGAAALCLLVLLMAAIFASGNVSPPTMFITMGAITLACGVIMPNALAGALGVDPEKAGSASGLIGFLQFAFAAAFSFGMGVAIEGSQSATPMLAIMFATALMCLASAGILSLGPNRIQKD